MRNQKNQFILLIVLSISVIFVACNKGSFNAKPLAPFPENNYPENKVPDFKILSWIRYNNTPGKIDYDINNPKIVSAGNLTAYGIGSFLITNPTWLFDKIPGTTATDDNLTYGIINESKFDAMATAVATQYPDWYVQIDAEAWSTAMTGNATAGPVGNITTTKDNLEKTIQTFKKYNTKNKIGFYGILPVNLFTYSKIDDPTKYAAWQAQNDALETIYDQVDVFFPSCYTRDLMTDSPLWKNYTLACIEEINRLDKTKSKPIFVGLTLQFGNGGTAINRVYVDTAYLHYQLETLLALPKEKNVKGVFYWTSNTDTTLSPPSSKTIVFDRDAPWVKTILQFKTKYNIQ